MTEKEENKKTFSTCFRDISCAEMIQTMTGQHGIGSLCAKMMKKVRKKKGDGYGLSCSEMVQSMMKGCCGIAEETKETKKEEDHVEEK